MAAAVAVLRQGGCEIVLATGIVPRTPVIPGIGTVAAASGLPNAMFSRIVPENSCVSCVTKPNCRRTGLKRMSSVEMPL